MTIKLRENSTDNKFKLTWGKFSLDLSRKTYIMGVLNRTPDSFSDGGHFMKIDAAVKRVMAMVAEGADIIDIGGESTRPGAEPVDIETELERTIPLIQRVARNIRAPISIDTSKSEVAEEAIKNGASMINDVSGLRSDLGIARVARDYDVPLIIMHMRGTPKTMQAKARYDSVLEEILNELRESLNIAEKAGVDGNKIIVDPGIGFGKTVEHNLEIINNFDRLKALNKPLLIGVSRKSFMANILKENGVSPEDVEKSGRLIGTIVTSVASVIKGANILRVHDVKEIYQAVKISDAMLRC
ncbi:MAG: dihydropteroate synthase [Candidatus Omnitrophica bacterium]|nr:dihydropteroate synthase [Candidatus Omnitrophota bacterium]